MFRVEKQTRPRERQNLSLYANRESRDLIKTDAADTLSLDPQPTVLSLLFSSSGLQCRGRKRACLIGAIWVCCYLHSSDLSEATY